VLDDPARAAAMAQAARRFAEARLDTKLLQRRLEAVILAAVARPTSAGER